MSVTPRLAAAAGALAVAGVGTLGYALWEARQYTLRDVRLTLPRVVDRPGPLRVLHLSDLHLAPRDADRIAWIRDVGALPADLTVVTGDFHGHAEGGRLALEALEPLLDRPGVFVRGSNDYYIPRRANPLKYFLGPSRQRTIPPTIDVSVLDDGLTEAGWTDLDNATGRVTAAGWTIDARGVDDPHIHRDDYTTVAGPFDPSAMLRLAVTHAPYRRVLDPMAEDAADLILAGHTHGGQICMPGVGTLVTNCDLPRAQAKGLSGWHGAALHVSAGLGTNPYTPIRLACRPEATLLTLS